MLGQKRLIPTSKGEESSSLIDISELPPGVYFLKVKTSSGIFTKKIVKE
jgi:hypothetical protein